MLKKWDRVIFSDEVFNLSKYSSFECVIEQGLEDYDPIPLNHSLKKNRFLSHITSDCFELHCFVTVLHH